MTSARSYFAARPVKSGPMVAAPFPVRGMAAHTADPLGVEENRCSLCRVPAVREREITKVFKRCPGQTMDARSRGDPRELEPETPLSDPLPANDQNSVRSLGQFEPHHIGPRQVAPTGEIVVLVNELFIDGHDQRSAGARASIRPGPRGRSRPRHRRRRRDRASRDES